MVDKSFKHDKGKPFATTLIRDFWPVISHLYQGKEISGVCNAWFGNRDDDEALERLLTYYQLNELDVVGDLMDIGTYGAAMHGKSTWLKLENAYERYSEAAGRHLDSMARKDPEDESGYTHRAHLLFNLKALKCLKERSK